ncbi:MAG: hydroxysqualene dehydroxylase HpnE [Sciscionella sp.]
MGSRVAVIGGGLAGLSCAARLVQRGVDVTLLEARSRLGGATFSFRRDDLTVDNGAHVLLRCYTEYLDFLRLIGSAEKVEIQPRFSVAVQHADGRRGRLFRTQGLPAPFHLGPALAGYRLLSPTDRARVMGAATALRFLDETDPALDRRGFGEWLRAHGQNRATMAAVWDLITVAALNTSSDHASLALAAMVFSTALLRKPDAADIGIPTVDLQSLHAIPAERFLRAHGAVIHTQAAVRAIRRGTEGFDLDLDDGTVSADAVVLAVPPLQARQLLDSPVPTLETAPIVNVHAVYSRRVIDEAFVAVLGSPVQWVFDRSAVAGVSSGQYLAVSLSAAERWIDAPVADLRSEFAPALRALFPRARDAELREFFVTRQRHATFAQTPGSAAARLPALTDVRGLVLAGSWTRTGYPDTMEGAVRSGVTAAEHSVAALCGRGLGVTVQRGAP